jgi:suppressor for copper-sensitivity B
MKCFAQMRARGRAWLSAAGALAALLLALPLGPAAADPAAGPGASASASEWVRTDQTQVRLVSAVTATGEAATLRLGLQFKLEPGWKIYWRSPGDAGLPPKADWAGSHNLGPVTTRWPAPERFELFDLDTFGYGDEVVLPLDAQVAERGQPVALRLALDYLVCEKICIPYEAALKLDLPSGPAVPSDYAHLIDRYMARVPGDGRGSGLAIERATWDSGGEPAITVTARATEPFEHPDVFVEGAVTAGIGFGKPDVSLSDGGRLAVLRLPARFETKAAAQKAGPFVGAPVTLTLVDGSRAMETRTVLGAGLPTRTPAQIGALAILGIAVLGGLILNLMPCVLPVLSLKLLHLVSHAGVAHARIRRNFLASAAGILAAFLVLAISLTALKAAGMSIGWGIQFQQPIFLAGMALVLALFTANLWGWFEFRLPGPVAAAALAASGEAVAPEDESVLGAFLFGAFATVLATPCSAPFVGTAVGFALARGPLEILAIFLALGVGLALPYLTVAAFPGLAHRLPHPGRWMLHLRVLLGLALFATLLWLLSVLVVQVGTVATAALAAVLVAILAVLWASRRASGAVRQLVWPALAALAVLAFVIPQRLAGQTALRADAAAARTTEGRWQPFDLAAIDGLVHGGHVVFVDVTADWCITCQVNKAAVVSRGEVAARLADGSVVPMLADWTRPNAAIAQYLASFGRYGIPFNVVYGPAAPAGIPLPEILTSDAVLDAFAKARGAKSTAAASP